MRALQCTSLVAFLALVAMAGCSGSSSTTPGGTVPSAQPTRCPTVDYSCIQHIVIIIQENRSFNNLFLGYPGAVTRRVGRSSTGPVVIKPRTFGTSRGDISHCWEDAMKAWHRGRMDGFDQEHAESFPIANCPSLANNGVPIGTSGLWSPYVYIPNGAPDYVDEAGPYWQMAMQYVLADRYFPTDFGPSFTAHQYLVAGTTDVKPNFAVVNYPGWLRKGVVNLSAGTSWSCDSPSFLRTSLLDALRHVLMVAGPFPCFTEYRTIANSLDARSVPWRFYTPTTSSKIKTYPDGDYIWSPFSAIDAVRHGPDRKNLITPVTKVLDAASKGQLKAVTWVVPDGMNSDHSGPYVTDEGPSWVAAVVNAVGKGPQWRSSAIVVLWDDWGGLYDPVPPPQMDFRGLGIRTPLIIISPYAQRGVVSHTLYEPGSILKFIETVFKLPPIAGSCPSSIATGGYTDCRANVLGGFDFGQTPRAFTPIKAKYPPSKFLNAAPSGIPPDNE